MLRARSDFEIRKIYLYSSLISGEPGEEELGEVEAGWSDGLGAAEK